MLPPASCLPARTKPAFDMSGVGFLQLLVMQYALDAHLRRPALSSHSEHHQIPADIEALLTGIRAFTRSAFRPNVVRANEFVITSPNVAQSELARLRLQVDHLFRDNFMQRAHIAAALRVVNAEVLTTYPPPTTHHAPPATTHPPSNIRHVTIQHPSLPPATRHPPRTIQQTDRSKADARWPAAGPVARLSSRGSTICVERCPSQGATGFRSCGNVATRNRHRNAAHVSATGPGPTIVAWRTALSVHLEPSPPQPVSQLAHVHVHVHVLPAFVHVLPPPPTPPIPTPTPTPIPPHPHPTHACPPHPALRASPRVSSTC